MDSGALKTADGLTLHTVSSTPADDPRAIVLLVHGIGEHSGRYTHVAEWLNRAGYAFYSLDNRGHGRSEGMRAYFEIFEAPLNDLKQYLDQIQQANPGKKVFLYGHSLGSLLSLTFALRYQGALGGLIVSGAPLHVERTQSPALIAVARLMSAVAPTLRVVPLPIAFLSHDPAVVEQYAKDPLNDHGNVRNRMGYHIVEQSRSVLKRLQEFTLPLLVLHGSDDRICPVSGGRALYDGAGSADKTYCEYDGFFHEIHNEPEQAQVLSDVVRWLDQHI